MFEVPNRMSQQVPSDVTNEGSSIDADDSRKSLFSSAFKPRGDDSKLQSFQIAFLDNLPLQYLRFYPAKAAYFLGGICYLIMVAVLLAFLVSSYDQALKQQFISIDSSSGRCSSVEKPLSGLYSASSTGLWEGNKGFYLSDAIYEVDYSSYSGTEEQFHDDLTGFYNTFVVPLGQRAAFKTLTENLVAMMGFAGAFTTSLDGVSYSQVFSFTATPATVFDQDYSIGTICSAETCCYGVFPTIKFQGTTQTMTFDHADYSNDTSCMAVNSPESLGYDSWYDNGSIELDLDMASLTVALSINLGYLRVPGILEVINGVFNVSYDGYTTAAYVDPRYKGMSPVNCFIPNDDRLDLKPFCWIELTINVDADYDPVYALPIINEFSGELCDCGTDFPEDCNSFDILAGLLYYKQDNWTVGYQNIIHMSEYYAGSFDLMNDHSHQAMMYSSGWDYYVSVDLETAFDFCTLSDGSSCNVLSINTYGYSPRYVSEDYYQIDKGNCRDVMSIPDFSRLAEKPPTVLTEQYYKCYPFYSNAFTSSLGIAFSLMSAVVPIVLVIFIPALSFLLFNCLDIPAPQTKYTDGEKNAAAKEFALHLLRVKDNSHTDLPPNSVLLQLGKELRNMSEQYEKANLIIEAKMKERAMSVRQRTTSVSRMTSV